MLEKLKVPLRITTKWGRKITYNVFLDKHLIDDYPKNTFKENTFTKNISE